MGSVLWRSIIAVLAGILTFHGLCISDQAPNYTFMRNATAAPRVSYYDYIVVGGGAAGCPLAATLSRSFRVLLLERGGSPYGNANIANLVHFADTIADLSPDSPSELFISEDGVLNTRARVLGGGTCLNAGFYSRAPEGYVRAAGWDAALVDRSYRWVERAVVHQPVVRQWQSALRDGLLQSGVAPYHGFTFEHLAGTKVGGSTFDSQGRRSTAADLLQHADPARLTVLLWANVHRVLFRHRGMARPAAHGVVFRDKAGGAHRAYLSRGPKNEILLSAGATGSPQLLMLSGVGPAAHLRSLGIRVVSDHPMVGRDMADNPMNGVVVPSPKPVELSLVQVVGITPSDNNYIEGGSGINFLSLVTGSAAAMLERETEPNKGEAPKGAFRGGVIIEKVAGPLSTGHLELRSADPGDTPRVTFNYFREAEDLRRCVEGMRAVERVIESGAFAGFRYANVSVAELLNATAGNTVNLLPRHGNYDSTSLEKYCRDTVVSMYHYHGGCRVGRVVDRDYRVVGLDSLRVVDASTFHYDPGTNPQATVMMLGRYIGMKIQEERLGKIVE